MIYKKILFTIPLITTFFLLVFLYTVLPGDLSYFLSVFLIIINIINMVISGLKAIKIKNPLLLIFPIALFALSFSSFLFGNYIYGMNQRRANKSAEIIIKALDKFYLEHSKYPKSLGELTPRYLKTSKVGFNDFLYFGHKDQFELWVRDRDCGHRYKSFTKNWYYNPCP